MDQPKLQIGFIRPKDFIAEHVLGETGCFGEAAFEGLDGTLLVCSGYSARISLEKGYTYGKVGPKRRRE